MWPFKRKTNVEPENVPPEVQEYYHSQSMEGRGIALLIGLSSLILTILLATGLFYGGRWAYRHTFGSENKPAPTAVDGTSETQDTATTEVNTGANSQGTNQSSSSSSSSTPSSPSTTPQQTPNTGPQLPNTGPDEDL